MGTTRNGLNQRAGGFTVIEVLIVLAIIGLIIMIFFLAIPALQRNAHNHLRKSIVNISVAQMIDYRRDYGDLPKTTVERCEFMRDYVLSGSTAPCAWNAAKTCDYLDASPITLCFHPDNVGHNHPHDPDEIGMMYGHWCNREPHFDGTANPIMDLGSYPLHAPNKFVVWTSLESGSGDFLYCVDNS